MMMLGYSRAKQASLAKLHILNDAIRNKRSERMLDVVVGAKAGVLPWTLRIEPAFARAIDFVVGDKFAEWGVCGGRSGLKLTPIGTALFEKLRVDAEVLVSERALLQTYAKAITEAAVGKSIGQRRGSQ